MCVLILSCEERGGKCSASQEKETFSWPMERERERERERIVSAEESCWCLDTRYRNSNWTPAANIESTSSYTPQHQSKRLL